MRDSFIKKSKVSMSLKKPLTESEFHKSLLLSYRFSKICGLLPVTFSPYEEGQYPGKLRKVELLYGFLLVLFFASAQTWGLWRDLRHGWKNSTRLSSNTAVTVTCIDVVSVAGTTTAAILSFPYRWKHVQKTLNHLFEMDKKMKIVSIKITQRNAFLLIGPVIFLIVISVLDYFTWLHSNKKNNLFPREDRGPINYSPIYLMYIVVTVFEIQYALITAYIGRGFEKMNQVFESLLTECSSINYKKNYQSDQRSIENKLTFFVNLHTDLLNTTHSLNLGFGLPLLFASLSSLLHLILTPYFAFIEVQSDNFSSRIFCMQLAWIIYHTMGLLITVQPCYWCTLLANKTGILICKLLTFKWNSEVFKRLEVLSLQVLHRPLQFSVCGLFLLDRHLVTAIAAAVVTYLVILLQFQDDGDESKSLKDTKEKLLKVNVFQDSNLYVT